MFEPWDRVRDESALRSALETLPLSGHILSVKIEKSGGPFAASVWYESQGHAENAIAILQRLTKEQYSRAITGGCCLWNETQLSRRGWPTLELAVAKETLSLVGLPRMRAARELMANISIPKIYDISERGSPIALHASETHQSCEEVQEAIQRAHFTASADRSTVVALYQRHRLDTFDKMEPDGSCRYDLRWDNRLVDMHIERLRVGGQLVWQGRSAARVGAGGLLRLQSRAEWVSSLIPRAAHFVPIGVVQFVDYASDLLVLARFWQQGGDEAMINFYVGTGFVAASIVGAWISIPRAYDTSADLFPWFMRLSVVFDAC